MAAKSKSETTKLLGLDLGVQLDERVLRWWIIIVLELTFAGLVSMFIIVPQVQSIQKVNDELKKQQKMAADLTYKAELLSNFSIELSSYEEVISAIFPPKKDTGLILLNLRKMAQENSVDLRSYSIRDTLAADNKKTKTPQKSTSSMFFVEMTVDGSAANIKRLLENINNSLPLKHVEDFQVIKSLAPSGDQNQIIGERGEIVQAKIIYSAPYMLYDLTVDSKKPITAYSQAQQEMIEKFKTFKNYTNTNSGNNLSVPTNTFTNPDWTLPE